MVHMRGLQFERQPTRPTLAYDASEHDHSFASIKEALGLEPPFAPRLLEHCGDLGETLSSPKDRLALGIVGRQTKLKLLVEVIAEGSINLIWVRVEEIPQRVQVPNQVHVLLRHAYSSSPAASRAA